MKTKILYLIRHTTPLIGSGICYGQLDVDVAAQFAQHSASVGNLLPAVELVITSPSKRAHKLAKYLAQQQGCAMQSDHRLMEMNFGEWEGRAWNEIARSEIDAWSADMLNYTPPNGESALQLMRRVQTMLQDLAQLPQQHIAIVAHGGSIRAVLAQMADIPLSQTLGWQIDCGAVISLAAINPKNRS